MQDKLSRPVLSRPDLGSWKSGSVVSSGWVGVSRFFQESRCVVPRLCACTSQRSAFGSFSSPSSRDPAHGCESEQTLSVQRYMRLKIAQIHSQWRGDRWPCWIRFQLFPRASALSKRSTVVDTVSEQYRTPPRSPIRARGQKRKVHAQRRRSGACVPTAGMKARGRANTLIDLVSSSSIDGTVNVFTESVVLRSAVLSTRPASASPTPTP